MLHQEQVITLRTIPSATHGGGCYTAAGQDGGGEENSFRHKEAVYTVKKKSFKKK